ncbi:tRNA adenosine(34) deaminase TadA [Demequina flava]|uniref:tRNA adenosine(34) deaminase TadA n=1 Tax=Demequina flava TaxID=1095025 RepID=UPI000785B3E5|nr:tRNA adenosine(34) deaminase TadA [Demequina flava]
MREALALARAAGQAGDVPVGAVVLGPEGDIVGSGRNLREAEGDPTAHAEVVALRAAASALHRWRLEDCTLVVTLEPCLMCAGAILAARIPRIVIGAWDAKAGATGSQWDVVRDARIGSKVEVISGVLSHDCAAVLTDFFEERR